MKQVLKTKTPVKRTPPEIDFTGPGGTVHKN